MDEMIDLHNHILSGLDDGAKDLEESLRMCQIGFRDGIRTIIATPHTLDGFYRNDRETIITKVRELNEAIKKFGVESSPARPTSGEFGVQSLDAKGPRPNEAIDRMTEQLNDPITEFKILPGADVRLCEELLNRLEEGTIMTVGDRGKFLFIEFPSQGIPYRTEEILFQLMGKGFIPIITHPERNVEIGQRPRRYYEMIRKGCLGQVTAMSLTGEFGPKVRQVAEKLLKNRLIQFIATDAHSVNGRPPILSSAVREAAKIMGKEEARKMVTEYPKAILEGKRPQALEPLQP